MGPKNLLMNGAVAGTGMVLFFILSGFLITNHLMKDQDIVNFLIKRIARIIPLAWITLVITLYFFDASQYQWISNIFFFANIPPYGLIEGNGHFWSLYLEIQFYLAIAGLVFILKKRAFILLPIFALMVTGHRAVEGVHMAINTQFRIDEILAGCSLAIVYNSNLVKTKILIGRIKPIYIIPFLLFSAHPWSGPLNYARPYIAMILIASTLFSNGDSLFIVILKNKYLSYIASVSYALYVFHGVLTYTWLGGGDILEKYLKRPLLLLITFGMAHISTKYFENFWINFGNNLIKRRSVPTQAKN